MTTSRFPAAERWEGDASHPAMRVNLDACIQCGLCVRGCREIQVNDVIGVAYRNHHSKIVFDFDDPMGESTCVACGECVQACPTGALMPAALIDDATQQRKFHPDRTVNSLCPFCGVGCQVSYQVKDDRIVYAEGKNGPANHNRLCVKGRFGFDYIHHPHRLTKPLIRLPNTPKSADDQVDPANPLTHFREASWEEALDVAAAGLARVRDAHGSKALAGFGSAKGSNEEAYLFQKLVRTGFGSNNVDHCTRLCHASSVAALIEGLNPARPAPFIAALDAELIVVIGSNPTSNHPVAASFIKNAAKARRQARGHRPAPPALIAPRIEASFVQARRGRSAAQRDAAYDHHGRPDRRAIYRRLHGKLRGAAQRIVDFPPEKMQDVCGIDAQTIKRGRAAYATSRSSIIFWGMGVSQHVHGTDNVRCLIALALVTGQVGRPGRPASAARPEQCAGRVGCGHHPDGLSGLSIGREGRGARILRGALGQKLDPKRGLTVVEIMNAIHADEIRGMYIEGENPAMSDPDLNHARAALAKLEHLVVQDLFVTETAFHADVILPASAFAEKTGTFTNTDRRVQMARAVVPPPGDARQDWWIIQEVAKRLGCDWSYSGPSEIFAEMARTMPSLNNITWERLEREGAVTYPVDAPDQPGNEIIFASGFPTASGRGKIVPANVSPPDELPDADYPMVLSTGRVLEHWHTGSMTRRAGTLDEIEPEATAFMTPKDMRRMGLAAGDFILLETRRGAIEVKVRADRDVPENFVFMPFCYAEAAANLLTNPALDPFGKIPEFKFCAARVRPALAQNAAE